MQAKMGAEDYALPRSVMDSRQQADDAGRSYGDDNIPDSVFAYAAAVQPTATTPPTTIASPSPPPNAG